MAEKKSSTAVMKRAQSEYGSEKAGQLIDATAIVSGALLTVTGSPEIGVPLLSYGLAGKDHARIADDIAGQAAATDALIAKARGGSAALGMRGVVPPNSLASRVLQKMDPGGSTSNARVQAGRDAASAEQSRESTPVSAERPAVTPNAAPSATGAPHTHHGWTDAARAASAQARGAHWNGGR